MSWSGGIVRDRASPGCTVAIMGLPRQRHDCRDDTIAPNSPPPPRKSSALWSYSGLTHLRDNQALTSQDRRRGRSWRERRSWRHVGQHDDDRLVGEEQLVVAGGAELELQVAEPLPHRLKLALQVIQNSA